MNNRKKEREKIKWLNRHRRYEAQNVERFRISLSNIILAAPLDSMAPDTYPQIIRQYMSNNYNAFYEAVLDIHLNAGRREYNYQRAKIRETKKAFNVKRNPLFNSQLVAKIAQNLAQTGGTRITSISKTLADTIIRMIADLSVKYPDWGFSKIVDTLKLLWGGEDFYRWQIARIVRTETTQAAQLTALEAMDDPDIYIDKVWLSVDDDRTRDGKKGAVFNHLAMDGIVKKRLDDFNIPMSTGGTEALLYPGDPFGSPGNVINCRCGLGRQVRRDANGNIIRKPKTGPIDEGGEFEDITLDRGKFEESIRNLQFEKGGVYTPDGVKLFTKTGQKSSVTFNRDQIKQMRGNILTHNHPRGSSFSPQDIALSVAHGLKEIRAVTTEHTHRLILGLGAYDYEPKTIINDWKKANEKARQHIHKNWYELDYVGLSERDLQIFGSDLTMNYFLFMRDYADHFTYIRE